MKKKNEKKKKKKKKGRKVITFVLLPPENLVTLVLLDAPEVLDAVDAGDAHQVVALARPGQVLQDAGVAQQLRRVTPDLVAGSFP